MKKRLLSIVTTLALCLTLLPATVLAEEAVSDPAHEHTFDSGRYDRSDDTYSAILCLAAEGQDTWRTLKNMAIRVLLKFLNPLENVIFMKQTAMQEG